MNNDFKHLNFLFKAATSENLLRNSPVSYCVAVNDYRYYRKKFLTKYKGKVLIKMAKEPEEWRTIKHPYKGDKKYGFKSKGRISHWYNVPWNIPIA